MALPELTCGQCQESKTSLPKVGKAKYYTTLDLRSGYHHIAFDKDAIKKTAFFTPFGE